MAEAEHHHDAIVIGSGFAGAVTACRLSQAGQRVCLLERGRRYQEADLPVLPESGSAPDEGAAPGTDRAVPDFARAFWPLGEGLWELRNLGKLVVGQAAGYGGGSLIYANVHLRAPEQAFADWPRPYTKQGLEGYYDLAAYMLQVRAMPEDLRGGLAKTSRFEEAGVALGHATFSPPLAVHFGDDVENPFGAKQRGCDLRGSCCFGCTRQAKNTLDLNYLRVAEEHELDVQSLSEVVSIEPDEKGYVVEYRDHLAHGRLRRVTGTYVFLCAGAVNTTELLLRCRKAKKLPAVSPALGERFFPNADDLVVAFDCDERQELDRGPTITSSLLYDDGESWLLVQDGGFPPHLEPWLGIFRSPLWMQRNRFGKGKHSPQMPWAPLPFDSVLDVFSTLGNSSLAARFPMLRDIGRAFLPHGFVGSPHTRMSSAGRDRRDWSLCPTAMKESLREVREEALASLARAAEPTLDALLKDVTAKLAKELEQLPLPGRDDTSMKFETVAEWALRLGVQFAWGSQAGMLGAIVEVLRERVLPEPAELPDRIAEQMRWALDYRLSDGHAALLLSMGLDTTPWRIGLAQPERPAPGTKIEGKRSGATGVVIGASDEELLLAGVHGEFDRGEGLLADGRIFGLASSQGVEPRQLVSDAPDEAGAPSPTSWQVRLASLHFDGLTPFLLKPARHDQSDAEPGVEASAVGLSLEAEPVDAAAPPERHTQLRLLRDIAGKLGGELRTNPVEGFLDRRISVHAQGGCAMAEDAEHGVTDVNGEVFGYPGLYVMDGASFPAPVGANPSATIAAVAERKVERFVTEVLGVDGASLPWSEHQEQAARWVEGRRDELDPIAASARGRQSSLLDSEPVGIKFEEVMKGRPDDPAQGKERFCSDLVVTVPDLSDFLARNRRREPVEMHASGKLFITGAGGPLLGEYQVLAESRLRFEITSGKFGRESRALHYELQLLRGDQRYELAGTKTIRDDPGLDMWTDTTTLAFELKHAGQVLRKGTLRVPATEFFGRQLPSFEATGVGNDPTREVWAIASFGRFFLEHLMDVYLPGLETALEAGKNVVTKGHV